jgi:two-component system response regulator HydG
MGASRPTTFEECSTMTNPQPAAPRPSASRSVALVPKAKLHVVCADKAARDPLLQELSTRGFAATGDAAVAALLARLERGEAPDVVVADLPEAAGLELVDRVRALAPTVPVILVSAQSTVRSAVSAMRRGAYDLLTRPLEPDALALALERALERRRLAVEVEALRSQVEASQRFGELVGQSAPMRSIFDLVRRVADTEATVLVQGESGTGKELVARAIHRAGRRAAGPFVAINCGALPEALLESELFGHVKGAFTDARAERAGVFREAHGGTLFLDEVGELPYPLQVTLLRALQERKVRPVGSDREVAFDARIISATNLNLDAAVAEKRFREDLFYRLNVVRLDLPPLRERGTDVLLLANELLHQQRGVAAHPVSGFSEEVLQVFMSWTWPGNVRELKNAIEHALAMAKQPLVQVEDLPERLRQSAARTPRPDPFELLTLDALERRHIERMLVHFNGNKRRTAEALGIDRTTLYRKLEREPVKSEP